MNRRFRISSLRIAGMVVLLASALCSRAETIILHTGARVEGTVVFRNDEVVILKSADGARFQYPWSDVKEIIADAPQTEKTAEAETEDRTADDMPDKKASILIELAGGAAFLPGTKTGAAFEADMLVGSHHIGARHLFIGAGFGYTGIFLGAERYNFIPIQAALRMPVTEKKHAPVVGFSLGYGVALSRDYVGGIYTGMDIGYRCQINPKTALAAVLYARFQQAQIVHTETLDDVPFTRRAGRNLVSSGLKFCLYF